MHAHVIDAHAQCVGLHHDSVSTQSGHTGALQNVANVLIDMMYIILEIIESCMIDNQVRFEFQAAAA